MGRYGRVLGGAINLLGKSDYTEGSKADLSIQHFIKICSPKQSNVFEDQSKQKKNKLQKPDWPPMGKMSHPL